MPIHKPRKDILLCYPFSESRLFNRGRYKSQWSFPILQQPKLNGERCRAVVQQLSDDFTRTLLFSSTSELITTVPHINREMSLFPPGEYDGELYVHGWTFSEIHSVVSTTKTVHPKMSSMQYHIFDYVDENISQYERIAKLVECSKANRFKNSIFYVQCYLCDSLDQIMGNFNNFIRDGYEGMIIRHLDAPYIRRRTPYVMKFKPHQTDEYEIVKYNEAVSESGLPLGMVGSFTCKDETGTTFNISASSMDHKLKTILWAEGHQPNSTLFVKYQTKSDVKNAPHFVVNCEVRFKNLK